jgi:hypothetical protein
MINLDVISTEVRASFSSASLKEDGDVIVVGTHNACFGNLEKAQMFLPVYREFVTRHHLLAWQEVDQQFLETIAAAGEHYTAYCTVPNSRGQAVGFTVHRRLQVVQTETYTQFQNINGIADLRPALRLDLRDKASGLTATALVVHFKSNHGGALATREVRRKQAIALVESMHTNDKFSLMLGDFNQLLEVDCDAAALISDGFSLAPRYDRASTHVNGGRLDGMLIKNLPANAKIAGYRVRNFWRNDKIGCVLSDHGLLSWNIIVARPPGHQ